MPRARGCHHNWEYKRYSYLPSEEGWERIEYEKVCSKCYEERFHYWTQFENQENLQPLARKFEQAPVEWKKLTTIYEEPL